MAINHKAYRDADGNVFKYVENGDEDTRAAADSTLTRIPALDEVSSNDENTNETPVSVDQITDFATEAGGAAPVQSVAGKVGAVSLVKADVGLGNVDNTSDADKPVSTAQQAEIDTKYDASNPAGYQNATQVNTIAQGLIDGLVDSAPGTLDTLNEIAAALGDDPNFATTITNQINGVQTNLNTEITDRTNADAALQSQITSNDGDISTLQTEQTTQNTNIAQNASDIAQEITDRANADSALQSQITSNDGDISSIQTEQTTQNTNISQNASDISQEATDRATADTNLQNQINTNVSDIAQEVTDRTNADTALQGQITSNDTDIAQNASDIAQEITDRTNADTALQGQITSNDGDISTLQGEQTTQDAAIALNTAKVSADGSINTHSDVDITGIQSGDQIEWDGAQFIPKAILNGFTIFPIWVEENGGIASGTYEWSFGNGAVGADIGIVIPFDCELFSMSFNAEVFTGTSASIDLELDGSIVATENFTSANGFSNFTAVPVTAGQRLNFRTNTIVGAAPSDVRVCAWVRVKATAAFPTPDRSVVSGSGIAFSAGTFTTIPGMSTTVSLSDTGTVDGIVNYSALRSGATNSITEFRVVINNNNGQSFFDTLSTFNDNGSAAHFVQSLPAGTYTVEAQCMVDQPITITSISLTATAVED